MKKWFLLALICLLTACNHGPDAESSADESSTLTETVVPTESMTSSEENNESSSETQSIVSEPTTNKELYALFLQKMKEGHGMGLYPYASDTLKTIFSVDDFQSAFCRVFYDATGFYLKVEDENTITSGDTEIHTGTFVFVDDMAEMDFQLSLSNVQITGYYYDLRIKTPYLKGGSDGIETHFFLLENGEYLLNAAYVKAASDNAPVVLLIPGSGPNDYNETIGILPTFQDLAQKLAKQGISTLRFEKRTSRYASSFTNKDGLDEEYFQDFEVALKWLEKNAGKSELWYLGHSLGANIAAELNDRHPAKGLILWNGSARHLADIVVDQYSTQALMGTELYRQMAENVKAVTRDTADGTNYFACSDYYWASYNELDTIASIKKAQQPTLIMNSLLDRQLFDVDRELWNKELGSADFVTIRVFDDQSHFGYKIDANTDNFYHVTEFPDELVEEIAGFIKK